MHCHPKKSPIRSRPARGVTLIELLVVIMIMLMISAVAIPVVAPALRNRETREAARMVDVFINGAKNRARSTGRPVGVVFELDVPTPGIAIDAGTVGGNPAYTIPGGSATLGYAEVPPAYTGDFGRSTINIAPFGATIINATVGNIFNNADIGWYHLVRPGDLIRFNSHATLYRIYYGEPYFDVDGNGVFTTGVDAFTDTNQNGFYDSPPPGTLIDGYLPQTSATTPLYVTSTTPSIAYGMWTYTFADPALAMQYMSWYVGGAYIPPVFPAFGQKGAATFEIIRQPVPQSAGKIELPASTAVDFGTTIGTSTSDAVPIPGSGYDVSTLVSTGSGPAPSIGASFRPHPLAPLSAATGTPPTYTSRVIITFAPNGLVDLVYAWDEPTFTWNPATIGWQGRQPIGPIYLLVGKRDLIGGEATLIQKVLNGNAPIEPCFNFQDPTNFWVVINPQTGAVMSTQNVAVDLAVAPPQGANQTQALTFWWGQTYQARGIARQALAVGGQ